LQPSFCATSPSFIFAPRGAAPQEGAPGITLHHADRDTPSPLFVQVFILKDFL
jgi:hypothetical protein